jgi:F-type H+-transporting ATPase subunit b
MQEILKQVEGFMLGAVPTMVIFTLLVIAYQILVQGPLTATLKARRARTVGAVEDAERAIARAEQRSAEYDSKLRQARTEVFKLREQRIKQWTAERDATLDTARKAAHEKIAHAKVEIEAEAMQATQSIAASAGELAEQVVRAVLPAAAGSSR